MANEKETRRGGEADLWDRFCDGLKEAGAVILRDQTPNSELVRAEGYRYLTRLLQLGLDTVLENADRERPDFFRTSSPTKKQGACNPDQFYDQAAVAPFRATPGAYGCPTNLGIIEIRPSAVQLPVGLKALGFSAGGASTLTRSLSISKAWPVIFRPSGDARNTARGATASGSMSIASMAWSSSWGTP
ncbi:MAG: hypothetical protein IIB12_05965, partial [Chloroflexi bacterium]|nr:hypothetical protein [Chloroflexota bacterium]